MQTWARRGVQAALVTGGMLAVGSGVAFAGQTCPERSSLPLGESVYPPAPDDLSDTLPLDRCSWSEPYPDRSAPADALAGPSDAAPVRKLRRPQASAEPHWVRDSPLRLAGWVADPAAATPLDTGLSSRSRPVTPAEGFHRSLSWAASLVEVRDPETPEVPAAQLADGAADRISTDRTGAELAGVSGGLLTPDAVDLTEADVPGLRNRLYEVPAGSVRTALTMARPRPVASAESVAMTFPGDQQMQLNEIPDVRDLRLPRGRVQDPPAQDPALSAPLPGFGKLTALGGGSTSLPQLGDLASALDGVSIGPVGRYAIPRSGEGSPFGGLLPDLELMEGHSLPLPEISANNIGTGREADTLVLPRI